MEAGDFINKRKRGGFVCDLRLLFAILIGIETIGLVWFARPQTLLYRLTDGTTVHQNDNNLPTIKTKHLKQTPSPPRHDAWDEWFQPLTELVSQLDANDADDNNNKRIRQVWNHSLYHPPRDSKQYMIMYYHVMKTGGSTLWEFFNQLNLKNGFAPYMENVDGLKPQGFGIESPGKLEYFETWRNTTTILSEKDANTPTQSIKKLTLISFREPLERAMSHYFQLKPCPDGTYGGLHPGCRESAQMGVEAYLDKCKLFSWNFQSRYLDNVPQKIETSFDFVLRSDKMEESFLLMSLMFRIPILDLILLNSYKVRTATSPLNRKNSFQTKDDGGCTEQWMKLLVNESIRETIPCSSSCAGLWGKHILTQDQLEAVKKSNVRDLDLWHNHVLPLYNRTKQRIMEEYQVSQEDMDMILRYYKQIQRKMKQILPKTCKRYC